MEFEREEQARIWYASIQGMLAVTADPLIVTSHPGDLVGMIVESAPDGDVRVVLRRNEFIRPIQDGLAHFSIPRINHNTSGSKRGFLFRDKLHVTFVAGDHKYLRGLARMHTYLGVF